MSAVGATPKIRLSAGRRLQWEDAQQCHVLLYPEGMVQLSTTAAIILQYCDGSRNLEMIIAELSDRFPGADLATDVEEFLQGARERSWISDV